MTSGLDAPLSLRLPATLVKKLAAAGLHTVEDLLLHAPRRYYHWGNLTAMSSLVYGQEVTLVAQVVDATLLANRQRGGVRYEVTLTDGHSTMTATFFGKNQYSLIPHQKQLVPGSTHLFAGKVGQYRGHLQLTHPQFEETDDTSEEATLARQQRPIPIYPLSHGLTPWVMQRAIGMVLDSLDDASVPEIIPESYRTQHTLMGYAQALRNLHQPHTDEDYQQAQRTLRWQEAYVLQTLLRQRALATRAKPAHSIDSDSPSAKQITQALPFTLTASQSSALDRIIADMNCEHPMMRLLQGDVGSGKTVVALLAGAHVIDAGYQVAMLVPTEVLAEQHAETITALLPDTSTIRVAVLTASTPPPRRRELLHLLSSGSPLFIVGTHALLADDLNFATLGLIIVDEQHRFGVSQRDRLKESTQHATDHVPHQLVMTATPIPRTIAMTVFGDLEETRMEGMPHGRIPISTYLVNSSNTQWMERLWQRAHEEIQADGRVYIVCPRIDADNNDHTPASDEAADDLLTLEGTSPLSDDTHATHRQNTSPSQRPPLASVHATQNFITSHPLLRHHRAHTLTSRTSQQDKNTIMQEFSDGTAPILIATTVIEVGINIPQATMMIILDAQQFGLSQLHQLRGRVGRSHTPSICMAVHPDTLPDTSLRRLEAFASTTDGFELARADLRLRKEGNIMGAEQSGTRNSLRFLSILRDDDIIAHARTAAHDTLSHDPTLAHHPSLKAHIRSIDAENSQWLEKA